MSLDTRRPEGTPPFDSLAKASSLMAGQVSFQRVECLAKGLPPLSLADASFTPRCLLILPLGFVSRRSALWPRGGVVPTALA